MCKEKGLANQPGWHPRRHWTPNHVLILQHRRWYLHLTLPESEPRHPLKAQSLLYSWKHAAYGKTEWEEYLTRYFAGLETVDFNLLNWRCRLQSYRWGRNTRDIENEEVGWVKGNRKNGDWVSVDDVTLYNSNLEESKETNSKLNKNS